jgi:hypothetical protein
MKKKKIHLRLLAPLIFLLSFNSFTQTISFLTVPQSQNDTITICEGNTVTFTDNSQNIPAGATYNWSFPGGNPSTATGAGPHTVEYSTDGSFVAELNVDGQLETINVNVSSISSPILSITNPVQQGFQTTNYLGQIYFARCNNSPGATFNFIDPNLSSYPSGTTFLVHQLKLKLVLIIIHLVLMY